MKEFKRKTANKKEQLNQERHLSKKKSRPSPDSPHMWEQPGASIAETPFQPALDSHASLLAHAPSDVQRASLARQLQQSYGNAYVQRLLESLGAQAKLTVSAPNDIYEQQADMVAEKVVGCLNSQVQRQEEEEELQMKLTCEIQRQEEEEELQMKLASEVQRQEEEEEELMMKPNEGSAGQLSEAVETRINAACGNGQQLSADIREPMEQALGFDFSSVRTHTDCEADTLNRQLSARAFTRGQDIFFREGEYSPNSESGQRLIAHELTHVMQQAAAPAIQPSRQSTS